MQEKGLVSVVVPIYNVEKYLDKCIESIVQQTYQNIEILLIDDGSTDDSLAKCFAWEKKDARIVVVSKENEGLGLTRNLGIKMARGEYLVFVDSDDYIHRHMVEKLYLCAIDRNADMVFCDLYTVDGERCVPLISNLDICGSTNYWKERVLLTEIPVYAWVKMYKKELFQKHEIWFTKHFIEDAEILPKLLGVCEKIAQVKEPLYYYRTDRQDSIMTSKRKQIAEQLPDIFHDIVQHLKKQQLFEKMKQDLEIYLVAKYYRVYYQDIFHKISYVADGEKEVRQNIEMVLDQYFSVAWRKYVEKKHNMLLWGSPGLKAYVIQYNIFSYLVSGTMLKRYNFSSLISAMCSKNKDCDLKRKNGLISNLYRQHMVENDVMSEFVCHTEQLSEREVIWIDFLEERYDIVELDGCYYTKSSSFDECYDIQDVNFRIIRRDSQEAEQLWKRSCQKFIAILKENFKPEDVYLVKKYAHKDMRDYDASCNICVLNDILGKYYSFFENNFSGIIIIHI